MSRGPRRPTALAPTGRLTPPGSIRIGRVAGFDVRAHWSFVVFAGFLVLIRAPWMCASGIAVVLVHELGHAFFARREGLSVEAIDLHAFGGRCSWAGTTSELGQITVAWGGVLAQAILLAGTVLAMRLGVHVSESVEGMLVWFNLAILLGNLLPIAPLDGATCWRIVPYLARRMNRRARRESRFRNDLTLRVVPRGPHTPGASPSSDLVIDDAEADAILRRSADRTAIESDS